MADAQDEGYNAYPLFDFPGREDTDLLAAFLEEVVKTLQQTGTVFIYEEKAGAARAKFPDMSSQHDHSFTVGDLQQITVALGRKGWECNVNIKRDARIDVGWPRTVVRIDARKKTQPD